MKIIISVILAVLFYSPFSFAGQQEDFVKAAFNNEQPVLKKLPLTDSLKKQASDILAKPYKVKQQQYWEAKTKRLWILQAMAKGAYVTAAVMVDNGKISDVKIIRYDGMRGKKIRYPSFLQQFMGSSLASNNQLDIEFQGITGATLSANAVRKIAHLALLFDDELNSGTQ